MRRLTGALAAVAALGLTAMAVPAAAGSANGQNRSNPAAENHGNLNGRQSWRDGEYRVTPGWRRGGDAWFGGAFYSGFAFGYGGPYWGDNGYRRSEDADDGYYGYGSSCYAPRRSYWGGAWHTRRVWICG